MSDIVERLRAACDGHPHALVEWPHRVLHEAADTIEILTENDEMKGDFIAQLGDERAKRQEIIGRLSRPDSTDETHQNSISTQGEIT